MNPFGWINSKELPYWEEPKPKYPRRKEQIRNLKRENRKILILILGITIIITLGVGFIATNPTYDSTEKTTGIIDILVVALSFAIAIISGLKSISKFRKGNDIDIFQKTKKKIP